MRSFVANARALNERFCPNTGAPLRVGQIWPPRLMLHGVTLHSGRETQELWPTVWVRHFLRDAVEVTIFASDEPATDPSGRTVNGLDVGRARAMVPTGRPRGVPMAPGEEAAAYKSLRVPVRHDRRFAGDLSTVAWIRKLLVVEFSDGRSTRSFQWHLYLTPSAPELPSRGPGDDLPHFRWVDETEGPLAIAGVAGSWIELPAPMSGHTLPPACWVQPGHLGPGPSGEADPTAVRGAGPQQVEIVATWPLEPAAPPGLEPVGWNGTFGGVDPRPSVQALAVQSVLTKNRWRSELRYWDTPPDDQSKVVHHARTFDLEAPTSCVWPTVQSVDERPHLLYDLAAPTAPAADLPTQEEGEETPLAPPKPQGVDVTVTFRVALPADAEGVRLERASIRLGSDIVGRWDEGPIDLHAAEQKSLKCALDLSKLRDAADGRLKLTFHFQGRPTRGVVRAGVLPSAALDDPSTRARATSGEFCTSNGPYVRLQRTRGEGSARTPWLVLDLGTEGTCAAVAFLDGFVPRVITVQFDDGPVYPSRVYLSPALGGVYTLAEEPSEDALYTTLIKLGLRFGDGAHPGCPDHIAATEVARFFLKRFLLEVRERTAWFPLHESDVLVSFPPRLAAMPRFVQSLRDTFSSVLEEVVWSAGRPRRLVFREEAFLVAMPCMHKDLQLSPVGAGNSRYYWVMDFGGGTTDVCGFLVTADPDGEEHTLSAMTYPQRLPHHLSGNDVTRAFYATLLSRLFDAGVVSGPELEDEPTASGDPVGRRFPLPSDPFPTARSTPAALLNQTALRELADALKCLPLAQHGTRTVRSVVRALGTVRLRSFDGVDATLLSVLGAEATHLGDQTVSQLHAEVLDPSVRTLAAGRKAIDPTGESTTRCASCSHDTVLPMWVFVSNRAFRFRCAGCGRSQRVQLAGEGILPDEGEEGTPVITAWRDRTVQTLDRPAEHGELYLEQDGRTYVLRDPATLKRWVEERRVGPDDRVSDDGLAWSRLRDRPDLRVLLRAAEEIAVDTTQEVPRDRWQRLMFPEAIGTSEEGPPKLGRDIRLFLDASREALERVVESLPDPEGTEVVVLVAGRASQFVPIAQGIHVFLPGRVVHLTNDWVRRSFGNAGQIDPGADLKTMTVNGGGLFALLQSNPETSHLLLSIDSSRMDVPVYLQSSVGTRPWLITQQLDLKTGSSMPIEVAREGEPSVPEALEGVESVEEPPPRPLPLDTPLTGDLQLVVDGLPEDRGWEPYVAIAQGTARRKHGRRVRTLPETCLRTEDKEFVLTPLTQDLEVRFTRMLPRLPLLGDDEP